MTNPVDFDNFTENYNVLLQQETRFFSSNEEYFARYKIEIVRQTIGAPVARILEYGCGIGRNLPFLQSAFPQAEIYGSDISKGSLEIARQHYPSLNFFQEGEDIDTNHYDLIFVAGVFHHVPISQRAAVAKSLYQRLTPFGQVVIFEHNPYNPVTRRIVSNCPYDEDAVLLKPKELRKLLLDAGFIIERQAYCLFVPPRFAKLSGLERYLSRLPLGGQYWIKAKRQQ